MIFLQQVGRNRHEDVCSSLELFADELLEEFIADEPGREADKAAGLAPFLDAALARKQGMAPLDDHTITVVAAAVKKSQTSGRV